MKSACSGARPSSPRRQLCPAHLSREAGTPRCARPRREPGAQWKRGGHSSGALSCPAGCPNRGHQSWAGTGRAELRQHWAEAASRPTLFPQGGQLRRKGRPSEGTQSPAAGKEGRLTAERPALPGKPASLLTKGSAAPQPSASGDGNRGAPAPGSGRGSPDAGRARSSAGRDPRATCLLPPPPLPAAPAQPVTWVLPGVRGGG
jgi:hypothetical protein